MPRGAGDCGERTTLGGRGGGAQWAERRRYTGRAPLPPARTRGRQGGGIGRGWGEAGGEAPQQGAAPPPPPYTQGEGGSWRGSWVQMATAGSPPGGGAGVGWGWTPLSAIWSCHCRPGISRGGEGASPRTGCGPSGIAAGGCSSRSPRCQVEALKTVARGHPLSPPQTKFANTVDGPSPLLCSAQQPSVVLDGPQLRQAPRDAAVPKTGDLPVTGD